jgi:KH domain-containing RNA-binding signal transduction-associated protein 2
LRKDGDVKKYLDVISNKNIKLLERVLIPVQQYPKVRQPNTVMFDLFLLFH